MEKTPEKHDASNSMEVTPDNKFPMERLCESVSFLRIQPPQAGREEVEPFEEEEEIAPLSSRGKRSMSQRASVEGSPFIRNDHKKLDVHPTPYKVMDFLAVKEEPEIVLETVVDEAAVLPTPPHSSEKPVAVTSGHKKSSAEKKVAVKAEKHIAAVASSSVVSAAPVVRVKSNKPISKLFVVCSKSDDHDTGCHQENARRTALLCGPEGCLRRPALHADIEWFDSDPLDVPPLTDLLRVHEYEYIRHLEHKCDTSQPYAAIPPFYAPTGLLDTDTPLVNKSLDAAKRFCSAAIIAVDRVMQDHIYGKLSPDPASTPCNRAFVIGRPPGHHAGSSGCVVGNNFWSRPHMASSGFCLLNTVAVAAAYARHHYGRMAHSTHIHKLSGGKALTRAPRIAIVDIDIHHGNGTQEIVANLTPHSTYLPLPSSWAPVTKLSYKPWLNEDDSKEVFFSSIHLFSGDDFYPCSGQEQHNTDLCVNVCLSPIDPGPCNVAARAKLTPAKREAICKHASEEFRRKVSTMLLPKLQQFQPDLLFISAGFDAHVDDFYHFLTEADLHWVTEEMCHIVQSNEHGIGVISILEGGYSLDGPAVHVAPAAGKGKRGAHKTDPIATTNASAAEDEHTKFAQLPGDGGLVKGVLSHAAALVGKPSWM